MQSWPDNSDKKKVVMTRLRVLLSNPTILKSFPPELSLKNFPLNEAYESNQQNKKMKQEKWKKRGGGKVKGKSQDW